MEYLKTELNTLSLAVLLHRSARAEGRSTRVISFDGSHLFILCGWLMVNGKSNLEGQPNFVNNLRLDLTNYGMDMINENLSCLPGW